MYVCISYSIGKPSRRKFANRESVLGYKLIGQFPAPLVRGRNRHRIILLYQDLPVLRHAVSS